MENKNKEKKQLTPFEKLCLGLSQDMDVEICKNIAEELKKCPDCHFFYNSIEKTIEMYREVENEKDMDEEMELRLLNVLNLDDFRE
jgi:predicted anti-sigma-YlaC factor YlaD